LVRYILPAGCYAFGGPTAHLAVFHDLFVTKLHWLNDQVGLLRLWNTPNAEEPDLGMHVFYPLA